MFLSVFHLPDDRNLICRTDHNRMAVFQGDSRRIRVKPYQFLHTRLTSNRLEEKME